MKKIIISVHHEHETQKYYNDSYMKNQTIDILDGENIHESITRVVSESDFCTFSYKGKPQGNVYNDRNGETTIVGYHYRTKHYIEDRDTNLQKENVPFTTWVTIHGQVTDIELEDVED